MSIRNASQGLTSNQWFDKGNDLKRAGDLVGALDAFRHSVRCNPNAAAPWIGLAQVLDANAQAEDARECLSQAVRANPSHLLARLNLANAHRNLGDFDDAEREYAAALQIDPASAAVHFGLGHMFEDLGKPVAAGQSYRAAIASDPACHDALASLLGLGRHLNISQEMDIAQRALDTPDPRVKALIGYGLGKAFEQRRSNDDAFAAYSVANAARRQMAGPFDRTAFDRRVDAMIDLFSQAFFDKRKGWGSASNQPIFIVGLPRSGTTLTEQILASHPDCFGAGELNVLTDLATGTPDRLDKADTAWPQSATALTQDHIESLSQDYLAQSAIRAPETARRIVDKQPLNFWHLGLIALALPGARVIHCTRDIRDCGLSIFTQNFNVQQRWATDLEDIAHYWRGYRRLMKHWRKVLSQPILEIAYEDTVQDIEGQSRRLLEFTGLDWDERVMQFHENDKAVQTPSRWQVRQPLYASSMGRWQDYAAHLAPLAEAASQDSADEPCKAKGVGE